MSRFSLSKRLTGSDVPIGLRRKASSFKKNRHEYYEYLSMIMIETQGKKTILDIFRDDALRYGPKSNRGALSEYWAQKVSENGDMAETFKGTLPNEDVNFIYSLQEAGGGILESGLNDLADLIKVKNQLSAILTRFAFLVGFASIMLVGMLFAIGYFLAPEIERSFSSVQPYMYGDAARAFFALGEAVRQYGFFFIGFFILALASVPFLLKNMTGSLRYRLDGFGFFKLYRNLESIRFMLSLATLLKPRTGADTVSLSRAIPLLSKGEGRWLNSHTTEMMRRLNEAEIGPETFDTGLFDKEVIWFLTDMSSVSPFDYALQRTKTRLEQHTITVLEKKAKILSWIILIILVICMLGNYMWVLKVIMDMASAMKLSI